MCMQSPTPEGVDMYRAHSSMHKQLVPWPPPQSNPLSSLPIDSQPPHVYSCMHEKEKENVKKTGYHLGDCQARYPLHSQTIQKPNSDGHGCKLEYQTMTIFPRTEYETVFN